MEASAYAISCKFFYNFLKKTCIATPGEPRFLRKGGVAVVASAGTNNNWITVKWPAEVVNKCEEGRFIVVARFSLVKRE